jgi:hypothetical protein
MKNKGPLINNFLLGALSVVHYSSHEVISAKKVITAIITDVK